MASLQEIGQTLKEAREAHGLSLEEISQRTHMSMRHLRAIEEGNTADLPEVFYVRGFLKKYAEVVGLSPADVADAYHKAPTPTPAEPSMRYAVGPIAYYLLIVVVIIGVLALAWHFQPHVSVVSAPSPTPHATHRPTPKPKPAAAATGTARPSASPSAHPSPRGSTKPGVLASAKPALTPALKPSAAPSVRPSSTPSPRASLAPSPQGPKVHVTVQVQKGQRAWLDITVDGSSAYRDLANPGKMTFTGRKVTVYAGNAGAVSISVDGKQQGMLGKPDEVVERSYKK